MFAEERPNSALEEVEMACKDKEWVNRPIISLLFSVVLADSNQASGFIFQHSTTCCRPFGFFFSVSPFPFTDPQAKIYLAGKSWWKNSSAVTHSIFMTTHPLPFPYSSVLISDVSHRHFYSGTKSFSKKEKEEPAQTMTGSDFVLQHLICRLHSL